MIVPQYWAEGRIQHRKSGRQVTIRRFGWSDESLEAAQAHADARTAEALERFLAGKRLERREPKIPYNGADGVPIREEIVYRRLDCVITRNSYGAKCLNTPNVFFADIDFAASSSYEVWAIGISALSFVAALPALYFAPRFRVIVLIVPAMTMLLAIVLRIAFKLMERLRGGVEQIARESVRRFIDRHPDWYVRLYRTPAGMRVIALHQIFDPTDPLVTEAFKELGTDPIYAMLCTQQHCFRARVSPKPWRIGIGEHLRPRPGVWPVRPEQMAKRTAWIQDYDAQSTAYAACTYIESLGSGKVSPQAKSVQEWHDQLCQANSPLPIA